ncbi:MAG: efflux RND transporter periplasmic adaptor subunit [Oscillospiraceae bacterium]|nr:efflux RND transporter periplasmic adaptor subunit [Oscillospiraceae bacterium]
MKRPQGRAFLTLAALTLLMAAVFYGAAAFFGAAEKHLSWAEASALSISPGFTAEGIIIRSELCCEAIPAAEGQRLAAGELSAPAAGLYFASADGYEHLSPMDIQNADAETVAALISSPARSSSGGKLILGKDWYFAALCPQGIELLQGQRLRADFGLGELDCEVCSAGEGFAVLRMDTFLARHGGLRLAKAEIKTDTLSGIAIPPEALRKDSGGSFVWVISAGRLEKKTVNILFAADGILLIREEPRPDALHVGDKLVIGGGELYEGKILT